MIELLVNYESSLIRLICTCVGLICKCLYYTLRFYFPYLSLLAQAVTILLYGPVVYGPARYLHYFR